MRFYILTKVYITNSNSDIYQQYCVKTSTLLNRASADLYYVPNSMGFTIPISFIPFIKQSQIFNQYFFITLVCLGSGHLINFPYSLILDI